jgi:hypothetical protein
MTPANITPCRTAVMAVVLNGEEHRITVEPGRSGRKHFEREIRRLFHLSQDDELEFTFDCQTPGNGAFFHALGTATALTKCLPYANIESQLGFYGAFLGSRGWNRANVWM